MMKMTDYERLNEMMKFYKIKSIKKLAEDIGVHYQRLYDIKYGKSNLSNDLISKILNKYDDISELWLRHGIGNMFENDNSITLIQNKATNHSIAGSNIVGNNNINTYNGETEPTQTENEGVGTPLYDVDATCGFGENFSEGSMIGRISIPNIPICSGAIRAFGNSMSPILNSGDIVAYRMLNNANHISYGDVYVIQYEADGDLYVVIKKIIQSEHGNEYIRLVSFNNEYADLEIEKAWVQKLAKVEYTIRRY